MTKSSAERMLVLASALVIGFGALIALAAHPATDGIVVFLTDLIFWPVDGQQNWDKSEMRLLGGISGGIMIGWGVLLMGLSTKGMKQSPEMSLSLIHRSIIIWFVVDSTASWIAGAPLNILGNLIFLGLFLWPARALKQHPARSAESRTAA